MIRYTYAIYCDGRLHRIVDDVSEVHRVLRDMRQFYNDVELKVLVR